MEKTSKLKDISTKQYIPVLILLMKPCCSCSVNIPHNSSSLLISIPCSSSFKSTSSSENTDYNFIKHFQISRTNLNAAINNDVIISVSKV